MCIISAIFNDVSKCLRWNTTLTLSVIVWIVMVGSDFNARLGLPLRPVLKMFEDVIEVYWNFQG